MSGDPRDYYRSSSLPPLRDVIGDALDHPRSPYRFDFEDIDRSLPGSSKSSGYYFPHRGPTLPPLRITPALDRSRCRESRSPPLTRLSTSRQPATGPAACSFHVLRAQRGDLVDVRTPSSRARGILRPTAIIEDEDETHKRYGCNWPGCEKKYDRPSSLEVHRHTHITNEHTWPNLRKRESNLRTKTFITSHLVDDLESTPYSLLFHLSDDLYRGEGDGLLVETIGSYAIGIGGSSDVWKGRILRPKKKSPLVAVKVLRYFASRTGHDIHKRLNREVLIWKSLDHESIAGFHGVAYNSVGAPAIISPWYANGSADDYLLNHPEVNPMKLVREIILGIEYLHDRGIIHGDLKGANIMVDDFGHTKIIDFGLSRLIDSVTGATGLAMTTVAFSVRWCAPELILSDSGQITRAIDIYALASTVLELLTGEVPYGPQKERIVLLTVLNKVPPEKPSGPLRYAIPRWDELWRLLECCWSSEASSRPSIFEVKRQLCLFYPDAPLI